MKDNLASIGIGALIIFIAMILVAGVTASVLIQTMNNLQEQALLTGEETLRDISSGLEGTHVSGKKIGSNIDQIAIFIQPLTASDDVDLTYTYLSLSDSDTTLVLNYTTKCFSSSASSGLFSTINASNLSSTTYGLVVIRDIDGSITSTSPSINNRDLVVIIVNTTKCFSGLSTRTEVFGSVTPEYGINGVIGFITPDAYVDTIIDLQP